MKDMMSCFTRIACGFKATSNLPTVYSLKSGLAEKSVSKIFVLGFTFY
jgi:hypothetical protein